MRPDEIPGRLAALADAHLDELDLHGGLKRLADGLRRQREDPGEARRVDAVIDLVGTGREVYELGEAAEQQGDLARAGHFFRRAAEVDHDDAAYRLATVMERQATQLTHTGTAAHESRRLIDEAARWYERAWVAGVAQAATALGRLHRAKGDQLEADSWFAKAAADGLGTAQNQDDFTDIGFSGAGVRQGRLAAELETPADGAAASCRAPRDIVRPASELAGPEHDVSAAPASPKMSQDEKKSVEPEREQQKKDFAAMLSWMGEKLREDVKEVRLSSRLTTSPACIVGDTHDITPTLEKMYRAMGHDVPSPKRILELNPAHPLVAGLRKAHEQDADSDVLVETAELLYGMALLAEGGELDDPSRFTRLLADRLARTL